MGAFVQVALAGSEGVSLAVPMKVQYLRNGKKQLEAQIKKPADIRFDSIDAKRAEKLFHFEY